MTSIIVLGSARSNGHTSKVVEELKSELDCESIDLKTQDIHPYDYDKSNSDDDFLKVMNRLVEHDLIIFATPVYWYAMSGVMKNFFDRITDCLKDEKDTGRKLRGKQVAAVACSSGPGSIEHFFMPFENTAQYLGMKYMGDMHAWVEGNAINPTVQSRISAFASKLKEKP